MKKNQSHAERTRAKIRVSMLVNRLENHALGESDMSTTQIRAAEILLNKTISNLQSQEITKRTKKHKVSRVPMTNEEWSKEHSVESSEGSATRTH